MPALHTFSAKKHEILADCETKLGYTFVDKQHCFAALNATGFRLRWSTDTPPATKNDRLAILGDIMLDTNLARKWFNNTTYDKVFGLHVKDSKTVFARAPGDPYASQTILPWALMVVPSQSMV
ncbi:hypothetical protein PMZ80_011196 [Knufia obscura]|uniref:Uncharacterized protein n=2 Tax=Knufia TaxID=430999 RepID=A0AAN8EI62_9EURO|nr:hypothetical protein PMZ80_011196 [Knufia obscura]KAK5956444.1 hypothetical protein OHC33_003021 [Knufia fluminis]